MVLLSLNWSFVGADSMKLRFLAISRFNATNCAVATEISLNTKNYPKSNRQPQ
jgi:hypothetical protein